MKSTKVHESTFQMTPKQHNIECVLPSTTPLECYHVCLPWGLTISNDHRYTWGVFIDLISPEVCVFICISSRHFPHAWTFYYNHKSFCIYLPPVCPLVPPSAPLLQALAQAIKEAKEQHPDMSVTKVVVHQETEITPE